MPVIDSGPVALNVQSVAAAEWPSSFTTTFDKVSSALGVWV